jgi:hypothetical protein
MGLNSSCFWSPDQHPIQTTPTHMNKMQDKRKKLQKQQPTDPPAIREFELSRQKATNFFNNKYFKFSST